jgi:branched-chain amino acid transport system ATP-binding protein
VGTQCFGRDGADRSDHHFERLKTEGTSILIVEQNLAFALRIADHVYLMSKGRIVHASLPDELRRNDQVKARYLGV